MIHARNQKPLPNHKKFLQQAFFG